MSSKKVTTTKQATTVKRGRPVVSGSKRQAVLAMREAKRAQGIEIKRGRPKMVKEETVVEVPAKGKKLKARSVNKNVAVVTMEDYVANVTETPKGHVNGNDDSIEYTWDEVNGNDAE